LTQKSGFHKRRTPAFGVFATVAYLGYKGVVYNIHKPAASGNKRHGVEYAKNSRLWNNFRQPAACRRYI